MSGIFSPTIEGSVAFEQPISQTSSMETVSNLVSAFAGSYSTPRAPTGDDRYTAAINDFASREGISNDVSTWDRPTARKFQSYAPGLGERLIGHMETLGSDIPGQMQAQAAQNASLREGVNSFRNTAEGRAATIEAARLYPEDSAAQEQFVVGTMFQLSREEAALAEQKRQIEAGANRETMEAQSWSILSGRLRSKANGAATLLLQAAEALRADPSQTLTGAQVFAGIENLPQNIAGMSIRNDNIELVGSLIQEFLVESERVSHDLQSTLEGSLQTDIFGQYNSIITSISQGADLSNIRQQLQDRRMVAFEQLIAEKNLGAMWTLMKEGSASVPLMTAIMSQPGFNQALGELAVASMSDGTLISENTGDDMSVEEARTLRNSGALVLGDMASRPNFSEENYTEFNGAVDMVLSGHGRAGGVLDTSVYRAITGARAEASLASSRPHLDRVGASIQNDLTREVENLNDAVSTAGGSIVFNGQTFEFVRVRQTRTGEVRESGGLGQAERDRLERINQKAAILGVSDTFKSILESVGSDYVEQQQEEVTPTLEAPEGAEEVMPGVYMRRIVRGRGQAATMGSIVVEEGVTSRMVREGAQERMAAVLQGPFQALQQAFGSALRINDAIALEGTSRESNTPNSRHFFGDAIDVDISGMNDQERIRLVQLALENGFQGIGLGNNILHIDLGERRVWNYGNATFGGMPIEEVKEMVRSGSVPRAELPEAYQQALRSTLEPSAGDEFEWDEGEGEVKNIEYLDRMPAPTPTETPTTEEVPQEEGRSPAQDEAVSRSLTPEASAEIASLIEGLTGTTDEDKELIRQYLESVTNQSEKVGPR